MLSLGGLFEWTGLAADAWYARWDEQINILLNQGASTSIEVSASSLPITAWRSAHCSAQKLGEPTFWRIEYAINCLNQPKTNMRLFVRNDQADAWIHRD